VRDGCVTPLAHHVVRDTWATSIVRQRRHSRPPSTVTTDLMPSRPCVPLLLLAAQCLLPTRSVGAQGACQSTARLGRSHAAWSAPRLLWRSFNDSASVHPNHAASDTNQLVITSEFVIADTSLRRRTEPLAPLALRLIRRTGHVLELRKPHPSWSYTGTQVAIDGRGVAHLFWSEVAGVTVADTTGGRNAVQVWTSRIVDDSLTTPELLAASEWLRWTYTDPRRSMSVDSAGNVHVVLVGDSRLSRRPLMILSRVHDRWIRRSPDMGRLFVVTETASVVRAGVVHVLFTSPNLSQRTAQFGSVFQASVRTDASATWSEVTMLHDADSAQTAGSFPSITTTPAGEIRAVWLVQATSGNLYGRQDVYVSGRVPGGTRFDNPHTRSPVAWIRDVESVWTDACGVTHVHARTGAVGTTGSSTLLRWNGRTWTEGTPFTFNWQYLNRTVTASAGPGDITSIWSSAIYGPGLPMILFWYLSDQREVMPPR
jgi:hypothetical protein